MTMTYDNGGRVVVDLKDTVDKELFTLTGDSDTVEDLGEVVRDETVTRPLREEGDGENDPHSLLVSLSSEERQPGRTVLGLTLDLNSGLALVEFVLSQRVLVIIGTVVLDEESHGLLFPAIVDAPSRGFGDEPDQDDLRDRRKTLEQRRDTP